MNTTIFYNGTIITMEEEGKKVESILVENGRIKAIGSFQELKGNNQEAELIDLQGKTMLPAFFDCHSHIVQFARISCFVQLNTANNFQEIKERLEERAKEEQERSQWLIGFGYDPTRLQEGKHPDKTLLDSISTKRPILIVHASGHMGCVNSKGLEVANIHENTENPVGGKIGRVAGSNEPNGYLEESAFMKVANYMGQIEVDMKTQLKKAQQIYAQYGITTAQDGFTRAEEFKQLIQWQEEDVWELDIVSFLDIKEREQVKNLYSEYKKQYKQHVKIGGYKLFLDGSPQGRTAWLTQPYRQEDGEEEGYCGYQIYRDEEVKQFVDWAKEDQMQLLIHCNGDRAIDQLLQATTTPSDERNVIIHAQTMRRDQLPIVKKLNLIPSYFIAHTFYWGDTHIKNLGYERASKISPVASTIKEHIPYTFHQDTPVLLPNMMEMIHCAVNRVTKDGITLDETECVSVYDALKAITVYAAYQYFEEDEKGTITVGKKADLIVLSHNPLTTPNDQLKMIEVEQTYKDGQLIYSKDKIKG